MAALIALTVALALACAGLTASLLRARAAAADRERELARAGAEAAAKAENYRQKLRALAESTGAGIVMLDSRGVVLHTNSSADRILHCEPESLVGHALIQATLSGEMQQFAVDSAAGGQPQTKDFEAPGGQPRVLRASAYPLPEGLSGRPEVMLTLTDVTELRRLETIRRDFVANVSHELRTPLASIKAMAETLQDGALQDEEVSDRFLGTIIQETDRLTRISEDLLVLSDAESKRPELERMDLDRLLGDLVQRFKPQAERRNICLEIVRHDPLVVSASKDQLEQVFVNLIDNAIKYTPQGGSVNVTLEEAGSEAVVQVADTGIGMLQEDLPRIFERFYRVDKARSRESGGTGLGLSIVKNIVEAHGGKVSVSSSLNHGSTFRVTLPLATEQT